MAVLTLAQNLAALADNTSKAISAEDIRNLASSIVPGHGTIYISSSSATTISDTTTYFKVAGTTTSRTLKNFSMPTDGRLTYTGTPDIHVHVTASLSFTTASNSQIIHVRIGKNGSATGADSVASEVQGKVGTGADVGDHAVHYDTMLSNGDYLEVFVRNESSASNLTMANMYFFALGMMSI